MNRITDPGKRIEFLCRERNISGKSLAESIGVSPSQISRIVNGNTKTISSEILIGLARELGVSADYILGMEDVPEAPVTCYSPMLLMSTYFEPGKCLEFIESLTDTDSRNMAHAEYCYFTGQPEKAVEMTEPYLSSDNKAVQLCACLIYSFANLSLNRIGSAQEGLKKMIRYIGALETDNRQNQVLVEFMNYASSVLLHLPIEASMEIGDIISELPDGLRLWGCYIMAHEAYLSGEYARSLGIIEAGISLSPKVYPIAMIYLHLMAAIDEMNLKHTENARNHFMEAWKLAEPDYLIEGLGEHHGLLQGLVETCMKDDHPEDYKNIINITYRFSYGWRRIHNPYTHEEVADTLTTTEFTIAMLANRGWTNSEIAEHMGITSRTVKQYLTNVYNKLNISNRKQLSKYMLK